MRTLSVISIPRPSADHGENAASDFELKQNTCGGWVVSGTGDHWGGIFLPLDAALKFARAVPEEASCETGSVVEGARSMNPAVAAILVLTVSATMMAMGSLYALTIG